jgi:hypothetical protein
MADLNALYQALRNADAAGDTDGAKRLAQYIQQNQVAAPIPEAKPAPFSFSDTAIAAAQSALGATKSTIEGVTGAGSTPGEFLEGLQKTLGENLTPERKAEIQRRNALEKQAAETGKPLEEIAAGLGGVKEAPVTTFAQAVGSSVPTVLLGMGAAALGATVGAPVAIAAGVGIATKYLIGAIQGAGEVKGSIYDAVKDKLVDNNVPEAEAKRQATAAQDYLGKNWDTIAQGLGLGAIAGGTGAETELLRRFSKPVAKQIAAKEAAKIAEKGAVREFGEAIGKETLTEGLQGGQQQYAENKALTREGYLTDAMKGVYGAAARDAAMGAIGGGGVHALVGRTEKTAPTPEPTPELGPQVALEAPVGTQGALFEEAAKKTAEPTAIPPATYAELIAERERLQAEPVSPEIQTQLDAINTQLAGGKNEAQLGLGLDFQRDYADLLKEREALKQQPQTPEVKTRVNDLTDQIMSLHENEVASLRAEKEIDTETRNKFPGLATEPAQQGLFPEVDVVRPEIAEPTLAKPTTSVRQEEARRRLQAAQDQEAADIAQKEQERKGGQYRLPLRNVPEERNVNRNLEIPARPTEITQQDLDDIGVPLRTSQKWMEQNVLGKTPAEIQVLVGNNPDLLLGTGSRAQILKYLTAPVPEGFKEEPRVTTPTKTNQPEPRPQLRRSEPSVEVSGEPASPELLRPRPKVPAPTGTSTTPDGLRLAPAGQPASERTNVAGEAKPTLNAPVSTPAAPKPTTPAAPVAKPTVAAKPAPKAAPAETPKAPPTLKAVEPVKSRYERLLDIANDETIPLATRKQAEKNMDALDDPTLNTSKEDRKGNEDYVDKFLTRVEGLRSVSTAEGQSLDSLKEEIKNTKGVLGNALRRMVESGKVVLEDAHPSGKKIGGFYDGEKVTLYANSISSGSSMAVALHEVGAHLGMERLLGKKQYNAVIDRILDMVAKADGSTEAKMAQAAYKRIPVSDFKRGVGRDEMVAYFVEEMANSETAGTLPKIGPMRVMWNQIKTAIVTSINKALGTNFGVKDFSAQDIFDIAKTSFVAESETAPTKGKKVDMASTSQFQNWFGDSKIVDKDGKPLVIYRGVIGEDEKALNAEPRAGYAAFGSDSPQVAASYGNPDLERNETGAITPLYIKANKLIEFPTTVDRYGSVKFDKFAFDRRAKTLSPGEVLVARQVYDYGPRANTKVDPAKLYSYPSDVYAWGKGTSVKSATGNRGTYDIENPKTLFSVSASTESLIDSMGPLDAQTKSGLSKLIAGVKANPDVDYVTKFRTQVTDIAATIEQRLRKKFDGAVRNSLGELNPMGLYRQAQDYSKMLLEYFQTGTLYKDPATGLWKSGVGKGVRPPAEVYALLDKYAEKNGYTRERATQIASRILEGVRLDAMRTANKTEGAGFLLHLKDNEIDQLVREYNADPDLKAMSALMDEARKAMVDNLVKVGRLTDAQGKDWKAVVGYVPFDRIEDFSTNYSANKKISTKGIAQLGKLPELIGSEVRPVGNVFDNYINTLGWMVGQTLKTDATVQTLRSLEDAKFAKYLGRSTQSKPNVVGAYVGGEMMYWSVPSKYDVMAFKDLNPPKAGWLRAMGAFSNVLRKTVTVLPPFALKQVTDDVQRAILTSGVKSPSALIWMSLTNFPKLALAELRGIQHPIVKDFGRLGLTGEYDFEAGKPASSLLKDLGYKERTLLGSSKLGELIHRLDGITRASDLAVRKAIYDQTLKEGGDELLAQTRAREFINFRRRGASDFVGAMVTTIPFFNAYIQGMDVLYRAASGKDSSASVDRAQARQMFWSRAGTVFMLSSLYALGKDDEDKDYQDMDLRTRDSNWVLPGGYKLSVPSELGAVFKVIPERIVEYMKRQGTPEEQTAFEAVRTTLSYMFEQYLGRAVPVPQAIKPVMEAWANKSFLTGKDLEGYHHKAMDPSARVTEQTSELAKAIAVFSRDQIGVEVSPIMIDNTLRGYFGSSAAMFTMVTDSLLNPTRVDRPLHKYALLSNYVYDPVGTRRMTEFYDEREKVGKAKTTLNELMKTDLNRAEKYVVEHASELQLESAINSTLQQLERTRAYRKFLNSPDGAAQMPAAAREKELNEIKKMEVEFVQWVREAKTELRKVQ